MRIPVTIPQAIGSHFDPGVHAEVTQGSLNAIVTDSTRRNRMLLGEFGRNVCRRL
jgi:hypothetical protein